MTAEEWRPVLGFEGVYEVSNIGRVRRRAAGQGTRPGPGVLRPGTYKSNGYNYVTLYYKGRGKTRRVHTLVAEAFIGPRPDSMEVCHGNGIPTDNRAENLRWDTHKVNCNERKNYRRAV